MRGITTELKVGLFVLGAIALIAGAYVWSYDGVRKDEKSYTLLLDVADSGGVYPGTEVRIAGVEVGSVESIALGPRAGARLTLRVRDRYQLPVDSMGELKATGLLGDYVVRLVPGSEDELLDDGDLIATRSQPGDIDEITRNLEKVSDDVAAITAVLREVVENQDNTRHLEATLANMDGLTDELRLLATQNRGDINAIVDSVRRLSSSLEGYTADIAGDIDEEMDLLKDLTTDLDDAVGGMNSIVDKIDAGEGTLGALVNDSTTIDNLNETIEEVQFAVNSFTRLRPEVYYHGRFFFGSQPDNTDIFFAGNPVAGSFSNTVGIRLRAHEDFWYIFEINDYPNGKVNRRQTYHEELGTVETRWIQEGVYRFTFQLSKRWGPMSFRLGIKESGGGIGATFWAWRDRLQVQVDAFDFFYGSYPSVGDSGIPNLRALVRVEPVRNVYFEGGMEQIVLGAKYGYATGFIGLGFHFTDDDIKWVLNGLPLSF